MIIKEEIKKVLEYVEPTSNVLEIGTGESTKMFAENCKTVVGIEANKKWYDVVCAETKELDNVELYSEETVSLSEAPYESCANYVDRIKKLKQDGYDFDVVYVDGSARVACVKMISECFPNAKVFVHDYYDDFREGRRYREMESILQKQKYWKELLLVLFEGEKTENKLNKLDVFIVCAEKDYVKLPYCINALKENVEGIEDIHVCSPSKIELDGIIWHHEEDILKVDKSRIAHRPNWIYQQFLKLFQDVTKNDFYMTIDADTIINRPLKMFEGDNPVWYYGWNQSHTPYYKYNAEMLGYERAVNHTFLADMNFFNKEIIKEMLNRFEYTIASFIE